MKLAAGVNFTNILCKPFHMKVLCFFSLITVLLYNFLSKEHARKMLMKLTTGADVIKKFTPSLGILYFVV